MISKEQVAHDLAIVTASAMYMHSLKGSIQITDEQLLRQMVIEYKRNFEELKLICAEKL
ncbi:hypothetical protein [Anaeromusa sp.]|uniref:hypothetical protein n=1 Tax=Anaeromusa sp. TaxID=1872520 RepID=UPI00261F14A3|nr:hypothetical protein [Anaeromusa sp.]MDD3157477.1 hypothetical protein [Anaeromusa sp.]